jgi:hypothetical protein
MDMTTASLHHRLSSLALPCILALALLIGCGSPLRAQSVAVMVNGEPITNYDIEQRSKLDFLSTHKQPSRQEVINELIDEKVKSKEGKKFGVDPSASDIEQSYTAMSSRMRITPDQLTKSLESQGIRADTLKACSTRNGGQPGRDVFKKPRGRGKTLQPQPRKAAKEKPSLRIQDAADRPDRAARIGAGRNRSATQGSRGPARACPELRGSQFLFQVDEERCHPRDRDQDLG